MQILVLELPKHLESSSAVAPHFAVSVSDEASADAAGLCQPCMFALAQLGTCSEAICGLARCGMPDNRLDHKHYSDMADAAVEYNHILDLSIGMLQKALQRDNAFKAFCDKSF